MCAFETKLLSSFERHLVMSHDTSAHELWDRVNGGPHLCDCGCGKQTKWLNWHRGYSPTIKGHWSRGLTKESDERVARSADAIRVGFSSGRIQWSKGLTAKTDARIAAKNVATSEGLRRAYNEGRTRTWPPDLTKESDERVAVITDSLHLTIEEVTSRIERPGLFKLVNPLESYKTTHDNVKVRCVKCDTCTWMQVGKLIHNDPQAPCQTCTPRGSSIAERELADFVEHELGISIVRNDRTVIAPMELDIWVPSRSVAIEYNSLYWHSELQQPDPKYHTRKVNFAKARGVKLVHVFADEWRDRRPIVESMIRARVGIEMSKVDARRCEVRPVDVHTRRAFFDTNHVDGDVPSHCAYGLFEVDGDHDGRLVQCMSLRTPRHRLHREAHHLEVARSCGLLGTYVRGGLGRLSHHCIEHVKGLGMKGLMTYVDQRFGGGDAYQRAGWQFVERTQTPRFWWTDMVRRYDRFRFRADPTRGMSERDVAGEAGVVKVFGCPNMTYVIHVK